MATISKQGSKWKVQVRRKGLGSATRSFINKKDAEKWGRDTEAAIEAGDFNPTPNADAVDPKATTLTQLVTRYKDEVSVKKKGAKMEGYVIDAFLRHPMAKKKITSVTATDWAKYRDERLKEIKAVSLKRQLCIFQHMYDIARKEWGYTKLINPLIDIELSFVDERRDRRLQEGELEAILAEASKRKNKLLVPIIEWSLVTSMRRSEVLALTWKDIDFKNKVVVVRESKNGHRRKVPLRAKMRDILEGLDPVTDRVFPMADANYKSTWKRILTKLGIEDLHHHDNRHEAISSLFELGLGIQEVTPFSGHIGWKSLARYVHPKPADILRKLEPVTA